MLRLRSDIEKTLMLYMDYKGFERIICEDFNNSMCNIIAVKVVDNPPRNWKFPLSLRLQYAMKLEVFIGDFDLKHVETYWRDKMQYFLGNDNARVRAELDKGRQVVTIFVGVPWE